MIEILKFRSLYHEHADPNARQVVTKGDFRVTRVGRFIRKTSLDELPQLFNVLRGETCRSSVRAPDPSAARTVLRGSVQTADSPAITCAPA